MFAGYCPDWRLQLILQCRVKVIRIRGHVQVKSPKQSGDILLTEKLLFLYIIELQNIYVFYKSEPTVC
jgi:hypothetical protein